MSKDIIKKPATGLSKWLAKETLGNFIYDQIGLLWRSAVMTGFVAACLRLFSVIPLDVWLIISLFLVALLVFMLDRVARRRGWLASVAVDASAEVEAGDGLPEIVAPPESPKSPYEPVHSKADHQAKNIRDFVTVSRVAVWEHKLKDPVPTIKWGFMIENRSVFPINLVEVRNNIFFEKTELAERRFEVHNEVEQLEYWREGSVVFEQRLSGPEAQYIKNTPDGKFRFNRLIIRVGNPNSYPIVEPQELIIGDDLEAALNAITYKETKGMKSLKEDIVLLKQQVEELKEQAKGGLKFEIDERQTQVGTIGHSGDQRLMQAKVRLRCSKVGDSKVAIREFSASLFKLAGNEESLIANHVALISYSEPGMELLKTENGWLIDEPLTPYRWYCFTFEIYDAVLPYLTSEGNIFRVTMNAVGQTPQHVDFFVNWWKDALKSNSSITLRPVKS